MLINYSRRSAFAHDWLSGTTSVDIEYKRCTYRRGMCVDRTGDGGHVEGCGWWGKGLFVCARWPFESSLISKCVRTAISAEWGEKRTTPPMYIDNICMYTYVCSGSQMQTNLSRRPYTTVIGFEWFSGGARRISIGYGVGKTVRRLSAHSSECKGVYRDLSIYIDTATHRKAILYSILDSIKYGWKRFDNASRGVSAYCGLDKQLARTANRYINRSIKNKSWIIPFWVVEYIFNKQRPFLARMEA